MALDPSKTLILAGPTASGKTAAAVELALALGGEVVSADSAQVYCGMDIGTAKPTAQEMRGVPHHMLSVADPKDPYSLADYRRQAGEVLARLHGAGKWAIVCGGTGLYIEGLLCTSSLGTVAPDPAFRCRMQGLLAQIGPTGLHERLRQIDPLAAQNIHPNNTVRVIRALEINAISGKNVPHGENVPRRDVPCFVLSWPREALYARIEARARLMIEQGLEGEVRALLSRGVPPDAQAMRALGYRQMLPVVLQGAPVDQALSDIVQATRAYAKRQGTWFKNRLGFATSVEAMGQSSRQVAQCILKALEGAKKV
nr:tRNA (adenosine(37)-N6)-dimethylallyltransferase MiaA [bacterium]